MSRVARTEPGTTAGCPRTIGTHLGLMRRTAGTCDRGAAWVWSCGRWCSAHWPIRDRYGRVVLIAGARTRRDFLTPGELAMRGRPIRLEVHQTVDVPIQGWTWESGFVTEPLRRLLLGPDRTTAFLAGLEAMMTFSARC